MLWDLLPGGKELGGAPANFAYHAQMLGAKAAVVSCVGTDALGEEIVARLDRVKLDRSLVAVDPVHPTGAVSVTLDQHGVPNYVIHTDVAWDFIPWSSELGSAAARADAVCFGSLCQRSPVSRETVRRSLRATPADSLRVFDINLRQAFFDRDVVHESLELSNVLKLNDGELPTVAKLLGLSGDPLDTLQQLVLRYSLKLVALTRGSSGSVLCMEGRCSEHPGCSVDVVDTVGAGDAFTAAVVMGMLQGRDLDAINDSANRLGAYVCSQKGAMPESIPVDSPL